MLYFDHNATTPLATEVAAVFQQVSSETFGNASSIHRVGQRARQQLENSRHAIGTRLGAKPSELVFTSGGTESNNLAITGLLRSLPAGPRHVITSTIEHPAVSEVLRSLQSDGVDVSYARVDSEGCLDLHHASSLLRPDTVLVSVMHANNETGVLQPIAELGAIVANRRQQGHQIFLHSDGVQAFGKVPCDVSRLGVDLYSVSGHKLHAPKGIGALYVRSGVPLHATQFGGRQERSRRAGTENVPAAAAFAKASELRTTSDSDFLNTLRNRLETELATCLGDRIRVNGQAHARLPNTTNIEVSGVSGEALVISLDMEGIAVSTGSACSSGSIEPSPVLLAMGRSRQAAASAIRISLGRGNTDADIMTLANAIERSVARMSKHSTSVREARAVLS